MAAWHPSLDPDAQRTLSERVAALQAAHPDLPPATWEHLQATLARLPHPAPALDALLGLQLPLKAPLAEILLRDALALAVVGPYPRGAMGRGILPRRPPPQLAQYEAQLAGRLGELESQDQAAWFDSLRRLKQQDSLALFAQECQGMPVRQTTALLSTLARGLLHAALCYSARHVGGAHLAHEVGVVGMGKLGGGELNYGSDVDLVFVCTQRAFDDAASRKQVEALLRHLIETFTEVTPQGYVFRVDLRLRPEGTQGLLVQSTRSVATYLLQWGRTWERSAWFKASWAGGSKAVVEQLLQEIHPFLYRRSLDFTVLDELKQMKHQVQANAPQPASLLAVPPTPTPAPPPRSLFRTPRRPARHAGGGLRALSRPEPMAPLPEEDGQLVQVLGWDVKLGEGGIREIGILRPSPVDGAFRAPRGAQSAGDT